MLFRTILLVIICQLMKIPFKSPTVITDFFNNSCYFMLTFMYIGYVSSTAYLKYRYYTVDSKFSYIDFLPMKCFNLLVLIWIGQIVLLSSALCML